jgi:phage terminase small subunit
MEGNPSHRPLPSNEPKYLPGVPEKPKGMSPAARRIWDELVDEMASAFVLRRIDQRALWHLCEDEALIAEVYAGIWKTIRSAKKQAKAEGKKLPGGALMSLLSETSGRMAMSAVRDMSVRVIIQRREFGLTPSARSRVEALDGWQGGPTGGGGDPLEMKLCG